MSRETTDKSAEFDGRPTVARYAVASRDAPRLTDSIYVTERAHAALVSLSNGSPIFTGCDESGQPEKGHRHAYILCESNLDLGKGDRGEITHITVYSPVGFYPRDQKALASLVKVWGNEEPTIQLVLMGLGQREDFGGLDTDKGACPILAESKVWVSRTPFVPTHHPKVTRAGVSKLDLNGLQIGSPEHEMRRLMKLAGIPAPLSVEQVAYTNLAGQPTRWTSFMKERADGPGRGVDSGIGLGFRVEFPEAVKGPIALGYGAHFGLGVFVPIGDCPCKMRLEPKIGVSSTGNGDLRIGRLEAKVRFTSQARIPLMAGSAFRSGIGIRLRDRICTAYVQEHNRRLLPGKESCIECPMCHQCQYGMLFVSNPDKRKWTSDASNESLQPLVLEPPLSGVYNPGEEACLGFVLLGPALDSLPYLYLALNDLGKSGLGTGYRSGAGRFELEIADCIGPQWREPVCQNGAVHSRIRHFSYADILCQEKDWDGSISVRFLTPAHIEEGSSHSSHPSFRVLLSHLLSRANALAYSYGTGELYGYEESMRLLVEAKKVELSSRNVSEINQDFDLRDHSDSRWLPPFFTGELIYRGHFSRDTMALLSLGEFIHVGKMAELGYGRLKAERCS